MTWRIELPQVTPWINANHRYGHWARKADLTRSWRAQADLAARQHGGYFVDRVRVVATIHKTTNRLYDPNNLADTVKACLDGIVSAGVLPGDSHREVVGPDLRAGEKRATACVVIEIRPIEEDAS